MTQPDRIPTWYALMAARYHAPVFEILGTRRTRGRYYPHAYAVILKDIARLDDQLRALPSAIHKSRIAGWSRQPSSVSI